MSPVLANNKKKMINIIMIKLIKWLSDQIVFLSASSFLLRALDRRFFKIDQWIKLIKWLISTLGWFHHSSN